MESHFPNLNGAHGYVARERVLTDLKTLACDVEDLLKVTASEVGEQAKAARERVTAALAMTKASCQELHAQGVESAKAAARKTDEAIRAHPYESLGIALGVGFVLGALLRRK